MPKLTHKLVFALAAAAALAGCESTADKQAKPAAVDDLIAAASQRCDLQGSSEAAYSGRLRAALMEAKTQDLHTLYYNDIAVCLDQRLTEQNNGFAGSLAIGMYYGDAHVLTIRDGAASGDIFTYEVSDYSGGIIEQAAYKIRNRATSAVMIAFRSSCGKSCTTTRLDDASDFTTYKKTPAIRTAPVKAGGW